MVLDFFFFFLFKNMCAALETCYILIPFDEQVPLRNITPYRSS